MNFDKIEKSSSASNEQDVSSELDSSKEFESMFVNTIQINKIIGFNPTEIINSCFAVLSNGNYIISYCVEPELDERLNEIIVYDPVGKQIKKKIDFQRFVSKVKSANNKIVVEWFDSENDYEEQNLTVFDQDLNVICEKDIPEWTLISATETYILCAFCYYSNGRRVKSWSDSIIGF